MKEQGKRIYIYGLVDSPSNKIIYVGKSTMPKIRLTAHRSIYMDVHIRILDIIYDKEQWWIDKLTKEGCKLDNTEKLWDGEMWEIGDKIFIQGPPRFDVKNLNTGKLYRSISEAARVESINVHVLRYQLGNKIKTPNREKYPFIIVK